MAMLAQLTTVKARLGIADTTDDTLLTNFIELATGRFNRFCNRVFARSASATFEFGGAEQEVLPPLYPIESVVSWALKSNETDGFVTQTGVECVIRRQCVISLPAPLGSWLQMARVTYTGGYVLPGTSPGGSQTALPDEIEHACVEQVASWYQNRHRLGLSSVSGDGGSVMGLAQSGVTPLDLLPVVQKVLESYRRMSA